MSIEIPDVPLPGRLSPSINYITNEELREINSDSSFISYLKTHGNPYILHHINEYGREISQKESADIDYILRMYKERRNTLSRADICTLEEEFSKIHYDDLTFAERIVKQKREEAARLDAEIRHYKEKQERILDKIAALQAEGAK